jgi:hypothetical protein
MTVRSVQACLGSALLVFWLGLSLSASAENPRESVEYPVALIEARLAGPLNVVASEQARPRIDGDRSARVQLAGEDDEPVITAKWKPVGPPGQGFNNEPRYELASYQLQKMFLEECEYVVPPIVLRALSLDEYRKYRADGQATLRGTGSALFLLSYWLTDVTNANPWDADRFAADPRYARHWSNLNILTHLVEHKDSNIGNLLVSRHPEDPRVFAVDNDVAFRSKDSDVGDTWKRLQVERLPAATVARLGQVTRADLDKALGVVAEFRIVDGLLVAVAPGENMDPRRGVRTSGERVQFGLTAQEIGDVMRRIERLLAQAARGRIETVEDSAASVGLACRAVAEAAR